MIGKKLEKNDLTVAFNMFYLLLICSMLKNKNKDFCNIVMPSEYTKILKFNQNQKSDKAPFIIYNDMNL